MNFKTDLEEIFIQSQHALDSAINAQQRAFIVYMANTAHRLIAQVAPLPQTEDAYAQVIPTLGSDFHKGLTVLYGYARMLINQPQQFGTNELRADQVDRLERVYHLALSLSQAAQAYCVQNQRESAELRYAPATSVDLGELLRLEEPLWRYWLRHAPIHLAVVGADDGLLVMANRHHLRQLIRHITLTMAQELVVQGKITLEAARNREGVCMAWHNGELAWTADNLATLFMRRGRNVYATYLARYGGSWRTEQHAQGQLVLIISLPAAS
ncbi:MAG: hypothetical protein NZ750_05955 [Anaerolineae bacterium]|nr:hypothetical protein [Anaerolineae bacterium]MDW8172991.1 hypothetical protein [Anaerolineae bacterium]